jgi:hypothetical protein
VLSFFTNMDTRNKPRKGADGLGGVPLRSHMIRLALARVSSTAATTVVVVH